MAVYISPDATSNGNGSLQTPFNSWSDVTLKSGTTYLQQAGTFYKSTIIVTASDVTFGSYGTGAAPTIGGCWFSGASHDAISGYVIEGNAGADVMFANGASADSVSGCSISSASVGALFASSAGSGDSVSGSTILGNSIFGVDVGLGTSGEYVENNTISNSGSHGVELEGNDALVAYNDVTDNGVSVPGSSGIHTYVTGPSANGGNGNEIAFNIVSGTHDDGSGDGNGVELDQWTHDNLVAGNVITGNDGAGIAVYGSYGNEINGNLLYGDEQGNPSDHGVRDELYLTTAPGADDPTYDNALNENFIVSNLPGVGEMFVGSGAGDEDIGSNYLASTIGGNLGAINSEITLYGDWWGSQGEPASCLTSGRSVINEI